MATIYRFVIEERESRSGAGGRKSSKASKGAGKGKWVSIFSVGEKGGVEHNRKMRAINPLLNKATGGIWEQGMRVGRAATGLVQRNTETGKLGLSGPALAIIIAWIIQTILKVQNKDIQRAKKTNTQDYKRMENGIGAIHSAYEVSSNLWNGRLTYNQNK